jgi:hypothetical protein
MAVTIDYTSTYQGFVYGFNPAPPVPEASARVYMPCAIPANTSTTLTASRIYYFLFPIYRGLPAGAQFVLRVSTGAASSSTRAGLYTVSSSVVPGTLVHDFGAAATATSSTDVVYTATNPIDSGYYFGAIISDGVPAIRSGGSYAWFHHHVGVPTGTNTPSTGMYEAGSGSTLPSTAGTVTWNGAASTPIFGVYV